ncbi:hypothetical protein SAMN00768000_0629 [Sulfobacillus thermosulfidooxidans DSM 9293]|uniref:Uncharacterized protein n=1 Tax=Sulfobacillus thermosulfidooxidans (strain DSM 9293 / VKM B-1269 / AT-1) TaxID=929705 RepID=A0A1W1W8A6_SULTA|nr:hypothetical protein [Sulfobacillus thermosulfidooxidans]SMC02508.1 hypothetical protein SAMN00768000_0629 [Sulfobacillus thermosulfidooxidans DSM 9293]
MKKQRLFSRPWLWRRKWVAVFVIFMGIGLSGCGGNNSPPDLAIAFARTTATGTEDLLVGRYTAQGHPQGHLINLGSLGLVAQSQIMASHGRLLWVTTGSALYQLTPSGHDHLIWKAPSHRTILSVDYISGRLWAVVERVDGQSVDLYCQHHGHFVQVLQGPLAITTLYPAHQGQMVILRVWPDKAQVTLWGYTRGVIQQWTVAHVPQGSVAVGTRDVYLPVTEGLRNFGIEILPLTHLGHRQLHMFSSVKDAVIEVIPSHPAYGLTLKGLIPLTGVSFSDQDLVKWPQPLQTTVTSVLSASWVIILDGPSQGLWFNARGDRFGPAFQVIAPPNTFPRAVQPWNA